jgi:hypothetical protein
MAYSSDTRQQQAKKWGKIGKIAEYLQLISDLGLRSLSLKVKING